MRFVPIADTQPSEITEIAAPMKAPGYDCSGIAYFRMVDAQGFLSFPDETNLGWMSWPQFSGMLPARRIRLRTSRESWIPPELGGPVAPAGGAPVGLGRSSGV